MRLPHKLNGRNVYRRRTSEGTVYEYFDATRLSDNEREQYKAIARAAGTKKRKQTKERQRSKRTKVEPPQPLGTFMNRDGTIEEFYDFTKLTKEERAAIKRKQKKERKPEALPETIKPIEMIKRSEMTKLFRSCLNEKDVYNNYLTNIQFGVSPASNAAINVTISDRGNTFSIAGPSVHYLHDVVPPTAITNADGNVIGELEPPLFEDSYLYKNNVLNRQRLSIFQACLDYINSRYKTGDVIDDVPPLDKDSGIVGWDMPYKEPKWLKDMFGSRKFDTELNPIQMPDGRWLFHMCGVSFKRINHALNFIARQQKNNKYPWTSIWPWELEFNDYPEIGLYMADYDSFHGFLESSTSNTAIIAWDVHARYVYKSKDGTVYFYDPWEQEEPAEWPQIREILYRNGKTAVFVPHEPDQGFEGSCQVVALVRVILIAEYGQKGATMKIPADYAVLASRLARMI